MVFTVLLKSLLNGRGSIDKRVASICFRYRLQLRAILYQTTNRRTKFMHTNGILRAARAFNFNQTALQQPANSISLHIYRAARL